MPLAPQGLASLANSYITTGNGALDFSITTANAYTFTNSSGGFPAVGGGPYGNLSDGNHKTNVEPIAYDLTTIAALKPVSYNMIDTGTPGIGFIAQDVLPIVPEAVMSTNDGTLLLAYDSFIPIHTKAIQQISASLESLKAEFEAYKAAHP